MIAHAQKLTSQFTQFYKSQSYNFVTREIALAERVKTEKFNFPVSPPFYETTTKRRTEENQRSSPRTHLDLLLFPEEIHVSGSLDPRFEGHFYCRWSATVWKPEGTVPRSDALTSLPPAEHNPT